jgi:hypothetical protein
LFTLAEVVPWGRSFDEYRRMFALSDVDTIRRSILGCADGPASFNAEATRRGMRVTSCDPLYRFSAPEIRGRIEDTYQTMLEQARLNASDFIWNAIPSVEELGRLRMAAMSEFLDDYEYGKRDGRYVDAALPQLPFGNAAFDLALCSHFLFLYTSQLGAAFHRAAIPELCRVASEVRIFPLHALDGRRSPYVDENVAALREAGFDVALERVPYEFQRGADEMMRIQHAASR